MHSRTVSPQVYSDTGRLADWKEMRKPSDVRLYLAAFGDD